MASPNRKKRKTTADTLTAPVMSDSAAGKTNEETAQNADVDEDLFVMGEDSQDSDESGSRPMSKLSTVTGFGSDSIGEEADDKHTSTLDAARLDSTNGLSDTRTNGKHQTIESSNRSPAAEDLSESDSEDRGLVSSWLSLQHNTPIQQATTNPCWLRQDSFWTDRPSSKMGPPALPHKAKLTITFRFEEVERNCVSETIKAKDLNRTGHYYIPFSVSPEMLVAIVHGVCNWCCVNVYADLLTFLQNRGADLDMDAFISFGDGRDEFLNKDSYGRFRWTCIADLFPIAITPSKQFEIPIKVQATLVNMKEPLPPADPVSTLKHHFLGSIHSIGEAEAISKSDHIPMRADLLLEFSNRGEITQHLRCPARPFSAQDKIYIGDAFEADLTEPYMMWTLPTNDRNPRYVDLNRVDTLRAIDWTIVQSISAPEDPLVPVLPGLTYQPHVKKAGVEQVNDWLHLSVRLVNRLESEFLINVELPMNVLINAKASVGATVLKQLIKDALHDALVNEDDSFTWEQGEKNSVVHLFEGGADKRWWIDIWVMPQGKKLDKYRRLAKKGGAASTLKEFVDPEMLKNGDRKLWVEAHFIEIKEGKKGAEEKIKADVQDSKEGLP